MQTYEKRIYLLVEIGRCREDGDAAHPSPTVPENKWIQGGMRATEACYRSGFRYCAKALILKIQYTQIPGIL